MLRSLALSQDGRCGPSPDLAKSAPAAEAGRWQWAWPWLALGGIVLVALLFRTYRLGDLPGTLFGDEAQNGVDALAAIGGWRPIFFPANNGREPLHIYLQTLSVMLLGTTPVALRIVNALLGTATVAMLALAGRAVHGWRAGLLAAAWLAVSYWHVNLSRLSFRAVELPLATAACLYCAAWALRTGSRGWAIATGVSLGLTLYTYSAARLFPFAFLCIVLGLYLGRREEWDISRRRLATTLALAVATSLVVASPLLAYFTEHPEDALGRGEQVTLGGELDPRIWHDHLRPRTLVENAAVTLGAFGFGGDRTLRHNDPGRPVFDFPTFVLFCAGLGAAFRRGSRWLAALYLAWIGVMALPSALTAEAPHFLRLVGVIPPAFLVLGLAADRFLARGLACRPRWAAAAIGGLLLFGALDTAHAYFIDFASDPRRPDQFDAHVDAAVERTRALRATGIPLWVVARNDHPLFHFRLAPNLQPIATMRSLPRAIEAARDGEGAVAIECYGCEQQEGQTDIGPIVLVSRRPMPSNQAPVELLDGQIVLLGWEVDAVPSSDHDGETTLDAWLYWEGLEPLGRQYDATVSLTDAGGNVVAVGRDPWSRGLWPTTLWHPGERYATLARVRAPGDGGMPGRALQASLELSEVPRQPSGPATLATVPLGAVVLPDRWSSR